MRSTIQWISLAVLAIALTTALTVNVYAAPSPAEGTHTVQPGETLSLIAERHGLPVDELVRANDLINPNYIYVGQRLTIPGSDDAQAPEQTSAANTEQRVHIVKPGETLSSIAARYGVTIEELARASGIRVSDILRVGQELTIPTPAEAIETDEAAPAPEPEPKPEPIPDVYVVQPGDTLSSIADRFGISVVALARANNLSSPSLAFVGRRLVIPKPKTVSPEKGTIWVEVIISRQRCYVYDGDTLMYEWVCSTGRRSSPTKPGTYYIQNKIRTAYGSAWDIWMPYWMGIYWAGSTENGFHGLPWNATTGQPTWAGLVGTPITYGCIMLSNENAKTLWDLAYIGMPVVIKY